jgi:hypothetical protein
LCKKLLYERKGWCYFFPGFPGTAENYKIKVNKAGVVGCFPSSSDSQQIIEHIGKMSFSAHLSLSNQ